MPPSADRYGEMLASCRVRERAAQAAARGLGKIGVPAIPPLAAAAKKQPASAQQVAQAFTEMGADAIPGLLDAIRRDKDERVRLAIARGLGGGATGDPFSRARHETGVEYVRRIDRRSRGDGTFEDAQHERRAEP